MARSQMRGPGSCGSWCAAPFAGGISSSVDARSECCGDSTWIIQRARMSENQTPHHSVNCRRPPGVPPVLKEDSPRVLTIAGGQGRPRMTNVAREAARPHRQLPSSPRHSWPWKPLQHGYPSMSVEDSSSDETQGLLRERAHDVVTPLCDPRDRRGGHSLFQQPGSNTSPRR